MTDLSTRRRRAGHLLLGAAALALPLTASVSYAQEDVPTPPAPPAPPSAVALPAPPEPPEAPLPADAKLPPVPAGAHRIVIEEESADGSKKQRQVIVMRSTDAADDGAATQAPVRIERRVIRRGADGKVVEPDSAEFEAHMKKFEKEMERFGERMEKSIVIDERRVAQATARAAVHAEAAARSADLAAIAIARAPRVIEDCSGTERVRETSSADGKRVIRICQSRANAQALAGIRQARNSIARNRHLPADTRAEVLKELDEEIADLESGK